jgi:hypothetical protein
MQVDLVNAWSHLHVSNATPALPTRSRWQWRQLLWNSHMSAQKKIVPFVSTSGRTVKKVESRGVRNDDAAAAPEIRCEDPGAAGGHKQDRRRLVIYTDAGARTAAAPG